MDDARHRAATGVSNRAILENLEALTAVHANIWIRIPVIPGVNDEAANLDATAEFLRPLRGITRVDLLPYHPTGEAKFARVGMDYTLHGTETPGAARLEALAAPLRAAGLATTIGGHV
jgi:pyruvate formate lyase activating enzyme